MAISEEDRHRLYGRLEDVLGPAEAATMMAHLPPVGWSEVATRRDVDALGSQLRAEMSVLGSELRGEIASMRGEMTGLRGEMTGLRGELAAEIRGQTRSLFLSLVGLQMTAAALAVTVARLV